MGNSTYNTGNYSNGYVNEVVKTKESADSIVTLLSVKQHLVIDETFILDDQLLLDKIDIARSIAEDDCGRDLVETLNVLEFVDFNGNCWEINESPYVSMVSLIGVDENGSNELVLGTDYKIVKKNSFFVILFSENKKYTTLTATFNTGYDSETLPETIRQAILVLIADMYDVERSSTTSGLNFRDNKTYQRLIQRHIVWRK